ncbi:MAG: hypothetical protein R2814_12405 [Flavobacteriaceae bacterium]
MKITTLGFIFVQIGCHQQKINEVQSTENKELIEMREVDQRNRKVDASNYEPTDQKHRTRVFEISTEDKISTNWDKYNAAFLLQHTNIIFCNGNLTSISPENYLLAYTLSKGAFNSGYMQAGYMVVLNHDRYLFYTEDYQNMRHKKFMMKSLLAFYGRPSLV